MSAEKGGEGAVGAPGGGHVTGSRMVGKHLQEEEMQHLNLIAR